MAGEGQGKGGVDGASGSVVGVRLRPPGLSVAWSAQRRTDAGRRMGSRSGGTAVLHGHAVRRADWSTHGRGCRTGCAQVGADGRSAPEARPRCVGVGIEEQVVDTSGGSQRPVGCWWDMRTDCQQCTGLRRRPAFIGVRRSASKWTKMSTLTGWPS